VTPEFDGTNCIDLVIIRSSPQVDSEWLRVYLNSAPALEQVTDASEGAIQQHFNVGSARELRIPDSPLDEQRRDLAEVLRVERATTELAAHVKMHLERLREYRSSLISAAVTGQLQVQGIARGA
jgi:type I restriction enzyme S subunit